MEVKFKDIWYMDIIILKYLLEHSQEHKLWGLWNIIHNDFIE